MALRLNQLFYTQFPDGDLKVVASDAVPRDVRQAFSQQIVNQYWDAQTPHEAEYAAAYLHQVTSQDSLFGWVYSEGRQASSPEGPVPAFICYHLHHPLDSGLLDRIFNCLAQGPITHPNTLSLFGAPEPLTFPDHLTHYQPLHPGVAVPQHIQDESYASIARQEHLNLFVPSLGDLQPSSDIQGQFHTFSQPTLITRQSQRQQVRIPTALRHIAVGAAGFALPLMLSTWHNPQFVTSLFPFADATPEQTAVDGAKPKPSVPDISKWSSVKERAQSRAKVVQPPTPSPPKSDPVKPTTVSPVAPPAAPPRSQRPVAQRPRRTHGHWQTKIPSSSPPRMPRPVVRSSPPTPAKPAPVRRKPQMVTVTRGPNGAVHRVRRDKVPFDAKPVDTARSRPTSVTRPRSTPQYRAKAAPPPPPAPAARRYVPPAPAPAPRYAPPVRRATVASPPARYAPSSGGTVTTQSRY